MKKFLLLLPCFVAASLHAQLPTTSPEVAGFDPARLKVLHATTKRFVDQKQHAGIITLLARDGKIVDLQTYGYRDVEKQLPMERNTICRMYSMSKIITCAATLNHMVTLPNNQAATRQKGFGLGVEVTTDLGQLSMPSSVGQFGWYGAATTYCQIDPKERIVAIALAQHFPFNQHNFFAAFQTGYYQALK